MRISWSKVTRKCPLNTFCVGARRVGVVVATDVDLVGAGIYD